jgi:hypothetical protein
LPQALPGARGPDLGRLGQEIMSVGGSRLDEKSGEEEL